MDGALVAAREAVTAFAAVVQATQGGADAQ
jgi:hypothetical protein